MKKLMIVIAALLIGCMSASAAPQIQGKANSR